MFGAIAAGIGAGASAVGQYFGNQSAKREAERNRNFQEYMSNSSYTRTDRDWET